MSAIRKSKPANIDWETPVTLEARLEIPWIATLPVPWFSALPPAHEGKAFVSEAVYSVSGLPRWMTWTSETRTLRGTPTVAGQHRIKVCAECEGVQLASVITINVLAPAGRFGIPDASTGTWIGHPQESTTGDVVLDKAHPDDKTRVTRIQSGAIALHQSGRITDAQLATAGMWYDNWSIGTGHPLRASPMRFLGVSLGGAASADGVPVRQLDAATRHREAVAAVGKAGTERLMAFVCEGSSLQAAAKILGVGRQDLSAQVIADLERLTEFYDSVMKAKDRKSWWASCRWGGR
jgi:hypothetical protein